MEKLKEKVLNNQSEITKNKKRRFPSKQFILLFSLLSVCVIINVVAWKSTAFCDWYTANIFPLWQNIYGRITSLVPFSFGEILIMIAVFGIPVSLVLMVILLVLRKKGRKKILKVFGYIYGWIIAFVVVTETLNCFVLYHCSDFATLNGIETSQHTAEELEKLGYIMIDRLNSLSGEVSRDEKGRFVLTSDLDETAKKAMKNLSGEFRNLDGFYVTPKPVYCSFFMSQVNLMGIYFPFSMEANYNNDMFRAKLPDTVCHELAHTKGYIQEDEASFIAFMACDRSGNAEYEYSGYLSAFSEVRNRIFEYADDETKIAFDSSLDNSVWVDIEANNNYWQSVREAEDTVIDSETAGKISDSAMETSLKMNGVKDGKKSYGRVTDLLLNYFSDEINKP